MHPFEVPSDVPQGLGRVSKGLVRRLAWHLYASRLLHDDHLPILPRLGALKAFCRGGPVYEGATSRVAYNKDLISWPAVWTSLARILKYIANISSAAETKQVSLSSRTCLYIAYYLVAHTHHDKRLCTARF